MIPPLPRYKQLEIIGINMCTYKVRNEINENETKRNEINENETKSTKWKRNETNSTKAKRNRLI